MKLILDEWIIREVIDTLYMARTTLLGITGLDSPKEVAEKSANETAITRRISKAIGIIQQSEQQEPFSCGHENGYDDAYLQEKIAKANKTWEGVDVDKYMDEVRGREQEQPEVDLEKEMDNNYDSPLWEGETVSWMTYTRIARHFAEWQKSQMLKEAMKGDVYLFHSYNRDATAILVDIPKENLGDKVRVIIVKEDEK